ncbi:hypothetical protein MIMGU_mgv1a022245mg [Erythranthe guttata]|uniref:DUF674 domain-containing protein n=1 Tax=Erythranthe guttata TaxID=4155 RepID=A0A022R0U7_ERYGU|nr:hypothetical protein MIMGU_mgv1a022245mg [Erythranthe guttata]
MVDEEYFQFSLKIVVNKKQTKVLFAEADNDLADVLLSFLTLPLGKIVGILKKHYGGGEAPLDIGSLTTLYNGVANLEDASFWDEGCKEILLNPKSSSEIEAEYRKLKLDISETQPIEYFTCNNLNCKANILRFPCLSIYYDTVRCCCGETMKRVVEKESRANDCKDGVFTRNSESFIISDELRILPNTTGFVQTLKSFGIADTYGAELRNVTFGFNEIMDLLKASLLSHTPLTDIILNKNQIYDYARTKYEPGFSLERIATKATSRPKKMNLKVVLQKSTNKLLFAQAEDDFVDFLFIFLAIPLGGVEHLLGSNTCLKSIDNLHRSVADLTDHNYLASADTKNILMNPELHHGYISENMVLPLSEQRLYATFNSTWGTIKCSSVKFVRGPGKYVKGPRLYKISDDLTVTPFCMASTLSVIESLNIPLSDVKEIELQIGLEEGLNILKASLTSTSALTDGLKIDGMFMKQPSKDTDVSGGLKIDDVFMKQPSKDTDVSGGLKIDGVFMKQVSKDTDVSQNRRPRYSFIDKWHFSTAFKLHYYFTHWNFTFVASYV